MSDKAQKARAYFDGGYNCAQAVFAAFAEEMNLDEKTALRLSSALGGGVGGLREVCGAVSGMALALGMLRGYDTPDQATKERLYRETQGLAAAMGQEHGSLICRELLSLHGVSPSPTPALRDASYYTTRPCARFVETCAALLQHLLEENN